MKLRAKRSKTQGKRTKLGLCRFLYEVFRTNELLPRKEKLTNTKIVAMVLEEFPDQERLHRGLREGGKMSINDYRRRYNSGTLLKGILPPRISYRYNKDGLPVDFRGGLKLLTLADQKRIADKFQARWVRLGRSSRTLDESIPE